MNFLKSLAAFFIALIALLLIQHYISLPVIPVLSVYIAAILFLKSSTAVSIFRIFSVICIVAFGCILYGVSVYMTIAYYPEYGNWIAVLGDAINVLMFLSAGFLFIPALIKERRR